MSNNEKIIYSGFYDAPLAFVVSHGGKQFLFWREFVEAIDEYPNEYGVYLLPDIPEEEIKNLWSDLNNKAMAFLGEVPVKRVIFDPTKRQEIDTDVLRQFSVES
jgi:hypothetical protein